MPRAVFTYTGGWQKFNVPAGVEAIDITLHGAGAGGVRGGYVQGKMRVNPKRDLFIMVGQRGQVRSGTQNRVPGDVAVGGGGAGGDAIKEGEAGDGGAGATYVRWDARDGAIKVVAGGAGGMSGDNAKGGPGGDKVGGLGNVATGYPEVAEAATGGTQSQSGRGGHSALGTAYTGKNGGAAKLARGGRGGQNMDASDTIGGGGGGGGFFAGGGGAAGHIGIAPAGGGAGGSNFTGGLYKSTSLQGEGNTLDGKVVISWIDPNDPNKPPVPPENIVIDGQSIQDGLATKAKRSVLLKGTPDDPNSKQGVRLLVRMSRNKLFTRYRTFRGTYDKTERRDKVVLDGLTQDTRYYLRIHTQDNHGKISTNYRSTNFWTNRRPTAALLVSPPENASFTTLVNVTFQWTHQDPDPSDGQSAFRLRWRRAATPIEEAGDWTQVEQVTTFNQWTLSAGTFKGNTLYEWQVKTRDKQDRWAQEWSDPNSFYVTAETTSPRLLYPKNDEAVVAAEDTEFSWTFRTPHPGTLQEKADLRYRPVGTETWTTLVGDIVLPGDQWLWPIAAETLAVNVRYEWEVRTYGVGDVEPSDWSEPETFWTVAAPESGPGIEVVASGRPQHPLGIGDNRAYVYERGGKVLVGEIKPMELIRWGRKRDDISLCTIVVNEWDEESRQFLGRLRTWQFEVVVFRNGKRVWEGPVTRLAWTKTGVQIEAKDVMAYPYRRIMRQGYNDSYRVMNGQQIGQHTVVERSARIIMNALAYDDPNVLPYLTPLYAFDDALNSRVVHDFTRTAWEEVDDLAATAGLDYTCSGRRIILWDTHRPVGRLPEMRDGDFSDPPIVSEYGMSAANFFAVTSNTNVYGTASKVEDMDPGPTGWVEQLASAYGETEAVGTERELTRADRERLSETLAGQAERNIEGRWPPPLVVRVPDNSTLNPELDLDINQLVPGVWIPLRVDTTVRTVSQWQKLDSVEVAQTKDGETISVVMSPAPQAGQDPDADAAVVEE